MDEPETQTRRCVVLLTVSGEVAPDLDDAVERGDRPRADYRVMQQRLSADLLDTSAARRHAGFVGRLLERIGGEALLIAWVAFRLRSRYDVVVTDGEQVGIPFAALVRFRGGRRTSHAMIVHVVTTRSKQSLIKLFRLGSEIDRWVTYCTSQSEAIETRFGVRPEAIEQIPFMVDTRFFAPEGRNPARPPMICAVGLERRDYPTLISAVTDLDVDVVVAAASPWSRQADSSADVSIPENVTVRSFTQAELRDLYGQARFSVMPLFAVDFQAGITAILESMAMGRAVVCTRTPGQIDTIVDGSTGMYVEPGDVDGLRRSITTMIENEAMASQLGAAARDWACRHADVEVYADRFAAIVDDLRGERTPTS